MTTTELAILAATSLLAATVNGALGYGYSSISVPIALLVTVGRVINPALVVVEVAINCYALFLNRSAVPRVASRVAPFCAALVPGVVLGAFLLGRVAPTTVKLGVFGVLLPLILLQASGRRWPIRDERRASLPLGSAVGVLYGLTTISGPPLALFWNNQGLAKDDFKTAITIIRWVESVFALAAYAYLGLVSRETAAVASWLVPGVLVGMPFGHYVIRRMGIETFRRVAMSFDAYLVAFGLARTLREVGVPITLAFAGMALTAVVDTVVLIRFFRSR